MVTSLTRQPYPLRVCHLGKYYPPAPGGIETHVQTLARAQAALGVEVSVLCVDHSGTGEVVENDGDVRVMRIRRRGRLSRLDLCPGLPEALRQLERDGVDILHLHTPNPTMLLALAMVRPDLPVVVTHHSDIIRQRFLKYALRPFERLVYGRAARVLSTSAVYQEGSTFLKRYDGRIEPLPLGLDIGPYTDPSPAAIAHARRLRATHPGPLWLAVGRLVYYKAFHVAIRALTKVPGTLMIVGTGPLKDELQHLARKLGAANRVSWNGYLSHDELSGHYHAATALMFPSNARSEAFGLVQVEAMASGCPVLNTAIPGSGVAWVSRHEESGLTVAVDDADALAAAANRLLDEPGLRSRLAAGAMARARREFDHLTMGRRSLACYARAMRGELDTELNAELNFELEPLAEPARNGRPTPTHLRPESRPRRAAGYPDASVAPLLRESLRGS